LTFKQTQKLGGQIRYGELGSKVVFWKLLAQEENNEGEIKKRRIPVLRYYTVFNVEQCSGLENHLPVETSKKEFEPDDRCEKVLTGMLDPPAISHGKESAYYRAATDTINMPQSSAASISSTNLSP